MKQIDVKSAFNRLCSVFKKDWRDGVNPEELRPHLYEVFTKKSWFSKKTSTHVRIHGDAVVSLNDALRWRAANNDMTGFFYLLEKGADIHSFNGNSVLLDAVACACTAPALWIVDNSKGLGIDLNVQDKYEWRHTKTHYPVEGGLDMEDRFQWQKDKYLKNTALTLAVKKGWDHIDLFPYYTDGLSEVKASEMLNEQKMGNVIRALMKNGADTNIQDACGNTALHIAMLHRDTRSIEVLLHHGARADIKNNASLTPENLLDVRYEDINPFLYQQTGNCGDYIHTLQKKSSWEQSLESVRALMQKYATANQNVPSVQNRKSELKP